MNVLINLTKQDLTQELHLLTIKFLGEFQFSSTPNRLHKGMVFDASRHQRASLHRTVSIGPSF